MMQFSNGLWVNKEQLQQGGFGTLTSTIFNFAQSLKGMDSDETEFALLSAICLISGGILSFACKMFGLANLWIEEFFFKFY